MTFRVIVYFARLTVPIEVLYRIFLQLFSLKFPQWETADNDDERAIPNNMAELRVLKEKKFDSLISLLWSVTVNRFVRNLQCCNVKSKKWSRKHPDFAQKRPYPFTYLNESDNSELTLFFLWIIIFFSLIDPILRESPKTNDDEEGYLNEFLNFLWYDGCCCWLKTN